MRRLVILSISWSVMWVWTQTVVTAAVFEGTWPLSLGYSVTQVVSDSIRCILVMMSGRSWRIATWRACEVRAHITHPASLMFYWLLFCKTVPFSEVDHEVLPVVWEEAKKSVGHETHVKEGRSARRHVNSKNWGQLSILNNKRTAKKYCTCCCKRTQQ